MTYSSSLAFGRQRFMERQAAADTQGSKRMWGKNQNTTSFRRGQGRTVGPVSNTIILVVLACLAGLLYLTQVTKTNAYSYRLDDLKHKQTVLANQHDQLTVESARLQAQERVKKSNVAKNLVTVAPSGTVQN